MVDGRRVTNTYAYLHSGDRITRETHSGQTVYDGAFDYLSDPANSETATSLAEFVKLQKKRSASENSWKVKVADLDADTLDLSVKNPNRQDETVLREPEIILSEIRDLDTEAATVLKTIEGLV